ncbi:hypothetical protein BZG01_17810 [Labilibaculum manganireducens]|uniref:Uncharacterized protein n=1 Tax=Labilibaculum manganireducens TaxID=1940525 RepID=A0A2N3HVS2_9BACT|nr:hypothetical protein [Labilibaculum manganireducens]PKQ62175.1 hypothetical protein BZG01_17810 [Labilibaculum manganireducens]
MILTKEEKEKFEILMYQSYLNKCLKKSKVDIMVNPTGFVRGIPKQLAEDMNTLALDMIEEISDKEKLGRLKYICEYFLSQKTKRRVAQDNNPNVYIYDKFTIYQEQFKRLEMLLKEF